MDYLNEQFIGEEIDCEALGVGTIIEVTKSDVKIATEYGIIELALEDVELDESYSAASKRAEASRQRAIKSAANAYKIHGDIDRAIKDHDLFAKDAEKIKALAEENLEELSKKTLGSYINKARSQESLGWYKQGNRSADSKDIKTVVKRNVGIGKAVDKLTKEEVELEEGQNKPYVKPHYDAKNNQSGWKASNKHGNVKFFGKDFKPAALKHAGLNEENLQELSKDTLKSYLNKSDDSAEKASNIVQSNAPVKKWNKALGTMLKRDAGRRLATKKLTKEEVELEEGRGRKPKQPKEGEKPTAAWLRHLERQRSDKPEKEEVEALGAQLRKAVSINKPVTFLNGDKKEITAGHAELFHDHMAARKMTADKQKFQNDAHASHDAFMKAIKSPIPGR